MLDEAVFCVNCGCSAETVNGQNSKPERDDTLNIVIKVFLILGCIGRAFVILPLAWTIPITVSIFRKLDAGEPIGVGLKVATLLLVNVISGICLLCQD